jgi:predicted RNase H-like HicB family nuclease
VRPVRVEYHREPEGVWADSPDLEGFVASGTDLSEVRALVREGLAVYLEGETVDILEEVHGHVPVVDVHLQDAPFSATYSTTTASPHGRLLRSTLSTSRWRVSPERAGSQTGAASGSESAAAV